MNLSIQSPLIEKTIKLFDDTFGGRLVWCPFVCPNDKREMIPTNSVNGNKPGVYCPDCDEFISIEQMEAQIAGK